MAEHMEWAKCRAAAANLGRTARELTAQEFEQLEQDAEMMARCDEIDVASPELAQLTASVGRVYPCPTRQEVEDFFNDPDRCEECGSLEQTVSTFCSEKCRDAYRTRQARWRNVIGGGGFAGSL